MINFPKSTTSLYDEPVYVEESINKVPFSYYKVTGQLPSGYYMGTVVHLDSDSSSSFIGKFSGWPSFFTEYENTSYKEVNEEIYQAAFNEVLEQL